MDKKQVKYDTTKWQGMRWHLTVYGQDDKDLKNLIEYFDSDRVRCAVIAKEFGEHKIRPHFQIYYELHERTHSSRGDIVDILGHEQLHIEKAKGTKNENVRYVFGMDKHYEAGFVEYTKNVDTPYGYDPTMVNFWRNITLRPFQQDIVDIANGPADRRTIHWIYESEGNAGKSILAEYLHIFKGAIVTGGSPSDMRYAITRWQNIVGFYPAIIIVDLARSDNFTLASAKGLESIKNGLFFSCKYESGMTHSLHKSHIFVFANKDPRKYKYFKNLLSADRWAIYTIKDSILVPELLPSHLMKAEDSSNLQPETSSVFQRIYERFIRNAKR